MDGVRATFPNATIRLLDAQDGDVRQRVDALKMWPRPQLIVDRGERSQSKKTANFLHLFYFLVEGGFYLVDELQTARHQEWDDGSGENIVDLLTDLAAVRARPRAASGVSWDRERLELGGSVQRVVFDGRLALVEKRHHHLYKLREWEANEVLATQYGDTWGRAELTAPARTARSRAVVVSHGDGPIDPGRTRFKVPDMHIRHYESALCASRQLAVLGDHVLPDTWRHLHARGLGNRNLVYANSRFARISPRVALPGRRLEGSWFFFDSEYPGHFGHITTEVISRYWGWCHARSADPSIRPLVSTHHADVPLPSFQRTIFTALGIDPESVELISPTDPVIVEHLVAATPQFENPHYVDPKIADTYRRLRAGLRLDDLGRAPGGIFVSRKPGAKRWCHQTAEVESFFADRGFHVFYPEDLPYREQAQLFVGARVIAGFAGSGMFNMLLNPDARIVLVAGDGYNAENEHLMAAANGNEMHYFWGRSDLQVADGHEQIVAARSDFTFDVDRFRAELETVT